MTKVPLFAAVALVAVFLGQAGQALAHECFVASRPAQGNAGAAQSHRWLTVQTEEFFTDPELGLTQDQIEDALALLAQSDIPESFTIFIGNHTIIEGTAAADRNGRASDGSGIDHIFAAYGEELIGILCTVAPGHPFCLGPVS